MPRITRALPPKHRGSKADLIITPKEFHPPTSNGWNAFKTKVNDILGEIRSQGRERHLGVRPNAQQQDSCGSDPAAPARALGASNFVDTEHQVSNLTHNDYLGLLQDTGFQNQARTSAICHPTGSGASRLLGGNLQIFNDLEGAFSSYKAADTSLYFSSGYCANLALMTLICKLSSSVSVFPDELNHASLIDGIRLGSLDSNRKHIYPHMDLSKLEEHLSLSTSQLKFIVTESIFSMDGDVADLRRLKTLADKYSATLIIDEAHALGCYGVFGSGMISEQGLDHKNLISINTCGKALASQGAFVSGPSWLRQLLINQARGFIYSTAPSPMTAACLLESIRYMPHLDGRRNHLQTLQLAANRHIEVLTKAEGSHIDIDGGMATSARWNKKTASMPIPSSGAISLPQSHIIPILIGDEHTVVRLAKELKNKGIHISAIRPPTVRPGTCRLRLSLNSTMTVPTLINILNEIWSTKAAISFA